MSDQYQFVEQKCKKCKIYLKNTDMFDNCRMCLELEHLRLNSGTTYCRMYCLMCTEPTSCDNDPNHPIMYYIRGIDPSQPLWKICLRHKQPWCVKILKSDHTEDMKQTQLGGFVE